MADESLRKEGIHVFASQDLPPRQDFRIPAIVSIAEGSWKESPAGITALLEVGEAQTGQYATPRAACDKSCYVIFGHGTHRSIDFLTPHGCLESAWGRLTNNITDGTRLSTCHLC